MQLRPYQERCLAASALAAQNGVTRQLWVLATGLGKTVLVSAYLAQQRGSHGTLGLMHREELLEQSREKILTFNPNAMVEIEKAESRARHDNVILASVQTVGRKGSEGRLPPKEWLRTLWIDEAHHAPADGYLRVADYFGLRSADGQEPRRDAHLIGTTATPDRLDGLGYANLFDDVTFRYDLPAAIRDGWLADVHAFRVESDLQMQGVSTRQGDYATGELAAAILKSNVTERAAQTWEERGREKSSIFFCVDKEHARNTAERLESIGAKVAIVTDETHRDDRRRIVEEFKNGKLEALVNVGVFTEGFDAPGTNAIYLLRPTKSRALYMQCLGRGTRKVEGKDFVELFDFTPRGIPAASVADIFDLPDAWELQGQSLTEDKKQLDQLQADLPLDLSAAVSIEDITSRKRRIQLFKASLTDQGLPAANMAWFKAPGRDHWRIGWRNPSYAQIAKMPQYLKDRVERSGLKDHQLGQREALEIFQNEIGQWELHYRGAESYKIGSYAKQRDAIAEAEWRITEKRAHVVTLLLKGRAWRSEPVSEKQIPLLRRKGVPEEMISLCTKSEASVLLDMNREEVYALLGGEPC